MDKLTEIPAALSIKQPWVDLILRGEKTIEVRERPVNHKGPILVHASRTLDWKSIELFGYSDISSLPRGGLVAVAEVVDCIAFTRESWRELMPRHRVVHPPVREPLYGMVLGSVFPLSRKIPCVGKPGIFRIPERIQVSTRLELIGCGVMTPEESR
jgi:ASCH domain